MLIGNAAADAIRQRNGTDYLVGTTAEVLRMHLIENMVEIFHRR